MSEMLVLANVVEHVCMKNVHIKLISFFKRQVKVVYHCQLKCRPQQPWLILMLPWFRPSNPWCFKRFMLSTHGPMSHTYIFNYEHVTPHASRQRLGVCVCVCICVCVTGTQPWIFKAASAQLLKIDDKLFFALSLSRARSFSPSLSIFLYLWLPRFLSISSFCWCYLRLPCIFHSPRSKGRQTTVLITVTIGSGSICQWSWS